MDNSVPHTPSTETSETAAERTSASARPRLDGVKRTIWLTRPDLRDLCEGDQERFEWWLPLNGAREYRALAETLPGVRLTLTRFMRLTWDMRPPGDQPVLGSHGSTWQGCKGSCRVDLVGSYRRQLDA